MRYLAAYMLCQLGGIQTPSKDEIKSVLESVGVEHDSERLSKVLSCLEGKNVEELIASGYSKMVSVPTGGAGPAAAGVAAPAKAETGAAPSKETAKEAKKESEPEESDEDMGLGLFD